MNHLIFFEQDIKNEQMSESVYCISDPMRLKHLQTIIDIKKNQDYKAILIGQGLCIASCMEVQSDKVTFQVKSFTAGERRSLDLLIGLSRPQAIKKVLEYCSGQPINRIIFYKAELSEKSYSSSKVFEKNKISELLVQGLSQCGRFHTIPEVEVLNDFPQKLVEQYQDKFILSLESSNNISCYPKILNSNALVAIGPERGFTDSELQKFSALGFQDILLSTSILRVETAIIAFCSQLELLNFQKRPNFTTMKK
ncbi:MAG: RNA methyltransferase [Bacteriovoracaceae bacterium]|jgi:16S rRNA (uracil1498-N3)-methyltransferase|nr:RNA methyltransferase [Bacteriovoracaceae bacterium]